LNDGAADTDLERDALARVARLRSRFRGALLGLAVGEAVAAPALYGRPGGFAPVRDLLGGGPLDLPRGAWAAHTALALASAHSLLATGRSDPEDQRARWRRWQQHGEGSATGECLGISASVARALVADRPDPALADGADALTRVAPFALRYLGDPDAMRQAVRASAAITSHRPETADAASAFADMMRKPESGFDTMDPANVSPLVVWLASPSCDVTGRMFEIAGGQLSVATGWQHGTVFDKGDRLDPAEVGALVADLVREAPEPTPVYGA